MTTALLRCIRFYQKTFSPDHGIFAFLFPYGFCRFTPSCSSYAYNAVQKHGSFHGIFYALRRILRCNPLSKPCHDPVV